MRKIAIVLCGILLCAAVYARPVTPEKALQVAAKVLDAGKSPVTKASQPEIKLLWNGQFERTSEAPAFYVFGREEGGFVLVSADDNVQPVLGFSLENPFRVEGMPDNVRWWMESIKRSCRAVSAPSPQAKMAWSVFTETRDAIDEQYLTNEYMGARTVQWNQTNPANYYCPKIPGETNKAVCGCVPLAVAEVMVWFGTQNWSAGVGTVPAYSFETAAGGTYNIAAHDLGTVYRWADMQLIDQPEEFYAQSNYQYYSDNPTITALGKNIGQLVYDIGTLLQVSYSYEGTGGALGLLNSALAPMMGYNRNTRELYKDDYPRGKWEAMLKEEIDKHPVYYSGADQESGHAYVADGYANYMGDQVFHFNLGWGGACNGYYYTDNQADLDQQLTALFDFYPNPDSVYIPNLTFIWYWDEGGLAYVNRTDSQVKISIRNVWNPTDDTVPCQLGLFMVNKDGVRTHQPLETDSFTWEPWVIYDSDWTIDAPANAALGDRFMLYYRQDESADWTPLPYDEGSEVIGALPYFPAAFIKTKASYHVGDYFLFELINQDYAYKDSSWYVTTPGGSTNAYTYDDYRVLLQEAGEYKIEVEIPNQERIVTYLSVN